MEASSDHGKAPPPGPLMYRWLPSGKRHQAVQERLRLIGMVDIVFLTVAVVAMASAHYLG